MAANKCLRGFQAYHFPEPLFPFDPFEPLNPNRRRPMPKRPFEVKGEAALKETVEDPNRWR